MINKDIADQANQAEAQAENKSSGTA